MLKKDKEAVSEVENFIERLRTRDLVISQEAEKFIYKKGKSNGPYITTFPTTLSEGLSNAISYFETNKDLSKRRMFADLCLIWINRAYSHGVIQEGKRLITKNKKLDEKVKHLQKRLNECKRKCHELEMEMAELRHKYFGEGRHVS